MILLAFFKLSLLGYVGFDLNFHAKDVAEAVIKSEVVQKAVTNKVVQKVVSPSVAQAAETKNTNSTSPAVKKTPPANMSKADWKALKAKEDELARKERSLRTLERDLDSKLAKLDALEARLKKMLNDADVLKDKKIKHLVGVYTAMKAKQAAKVIETLDTDLAVKILAGMRGRSAGAILGLVEPKKAARLSEELTKLQIPLGQ